jgi:ubiquinone/menaquinone biosynthesis C-methylase UbiE
VTTRQAYAFDNDSRHATSHHDALTKLLDGFTIARADELVDLRGARCLEVAAGGGGFAGWLAEQVGEGGEVLATDLKPGHIAEHPRLVVRQHDITSDPLDGTFDFVHARLLLNHLPQRREVLHRLAGVLRPGGVLLTEDFHPMPGPEFVAYAPEPAIAEVLARYQDAHMEVLSRHGNDRGWSRRALAVMVEEGLAEVGTVLHATSWRGGGAGCQLLAAGLDQLRSEFTEVGMRPEELDQVRALFGDPRVVIHGHRLYSTAGRRPA